jgi:hypothetical protein
MLFFAGRDERRVAIASHRLARAGTAFGLAIWLGLAFIGA